MSFVFAPGLSAANPKAGHKGSTAASDPDYIPALAAADRFLTAWQNHDHETVLLMLSNAAKHQTSAETLDTFVEADPEAERAYEISRRQEAEN